MPSFRPPAAPLQAESDSMPTDKTSAVLSGTAGRNAAMGGSSPFQQSYNATSVAAPPISTPVAQGGPTFSLSNNVSLPYGVNNPAPPPANGGLGDDYFNSPYYTAAPTPSNFYAPVATPSATATAPLGGGTPGLNAPTPNANNPFAGMPTSIPNPSGENALSGGSIPYNPIWYSSQEAAQKLAQLAGGSVTTANNGISSNQPQYMVQLPNGQTVYPGAIADLYSNPVYSGNQGIIDYKMAEMLNNNAVGSTDVAHKGLYSVKNGAISYDPNGTAQQTTSTPISMPQYNAWLTRNALAGATGYGNGNQPQTGNWSTLLGSPGTGAAAVTGAPNAQQLAQLQSQYGVTPAAQGVQSGGGGVNDALTQLASFFNLLSGGNNSLNQQQGSAGSAQTLQLLQLLMLLQGAGSNTGSLYSRSQYPRFP